MDLPQTVTDFTQEIESRLMVKVAVLPKAKGVYMLLPAAQPIAFLFYCSLHFSIQHEEVSDLDIKVVHIDEDLYVHKRQIILNRIDALLGKATRIYARETFVSRVDKESAFAFQKKHHLQVALPGKYRYALFHKHELLSLAVFSGGRKMNGQVANYRSFELLRFCHKSSYLVVGGLSKLLKGFVRDFHPGDIMTYIDRDWSDGERYKQLGFTHEGILKPQAFYIQHNAKRTYQPPPAPYHTLFNLGSIKMRYTV